MDEFECFKKSGYTAKEMLDHTACVAKYLKGDKEAFVDESCKLSCKISNKWSEKPFEPEMIQDYIMCIDKAMRAFFGIQIQEIIDDFIINCGDGNWDHMWLTTKEEEKTIDEWAHDLWAEVLYCSDRWSWDRLIRTNWIFQRVNTLYKAGKKSYAELLNCC